MAQNNPKHIHKQLLFMFIIFIVIILNSSTKIVRADEDLIQKTCKTTKYTDLCISSLKSDPTSSTTDLKGLATIMVNVGIVNATETYSYLSTQLQTSSVASDATMKKVLGLCASKYSYANDSLRSALDDISSETYDYAAIHVTAAADYPNACRAAFKCYRALVYSAQLKAREDGFKRICGVLLGIFDQLFTNAFGTHS